ncbi:unnamed protein product [Phaeothamnion confervicola]
MVPPSLLLTCAIGLFVLGIIFGRSRWPFDDVGVTLEAGGGVTMLRSSGHGTGSFRLEASSRIDWSAPGKDDSRESVPMGGNGISLGAPSQRRKTYFVVESYGLVTDAVAEVFTRYAQQLTGVAEVWVNYDTTCRKVVPGESYKKHM